MWVVGSPKPSEIKNLTPGSVATVQLGLALPALTGTWLLESSRAMSLVTGFT